jgi:sporulation protein YlmC with PRC-barrel domain
MSRRHLMRCLGLWLLVGALAPAAYAQGPWDPARLYANTWSAQDMLGAEARDVNGDAIGQVRDLVVDARGQIHRVVIGVSGVLGVGERYIGVPWNELVIGPDLRFVQAPVREDNLPEFSLFTGIEDDLHIAEGAWRVNRLIGEFASLEDMPRYGLITDVIFDQRGQAQGVIVDRRRGPWGRMGTYGYPYSGEPGASPDRLPYRTDDVGAVPRFSYLELGRQSPYASEAGERATQERLSETWIAAREAQHKQLYRNAFSAEELLGTEVRDVNGEPIGEVRDLIVEREGDIDRMVVAVSGVLGIGERYLGVPWNEIDIARDMRYVQVPVRADNLPEFSLFTGVQDDVPMHAGHWRINQLLGDYASLRDVARFGLVTDVIFDRQGTARAVIVDRGAGWWGGAGWYAFPYAGYDRKARTYELPYRGDVIGALPRFDYVELGRLSDFSSPDSARGREQREARERKAAVAETGERLSTNQ